MKLRLMRKTTSITVVLCFLWGQCVHAVPTGGISFIPQGEMPSFMQIEIPEDLAIVEEIYEAPPKINPRLVLHIQNAHSSYEAQVKIKELLEYLNDKYAFKLIFVEGASEELDPKYLELFPDKDKNMALGNYLVQNGNLTGAEYFMMDAPKDVSALGLEEAELYRKNYFAFREVLGRSDEIENFLNQFEAQMEAFSSRRFSNEMRRLISEWKGFEGGRREFLPYVRRLARDAKKVIGLDLESLFAQVEWPQTTRLLVLQSMEAELNIEKAELEKSSLGQFLKNKGVSERLIRDVQDLGSKKIRMMRIENESQRQKQTPRYLLERLVEEAGPKGFYFHDFPAFSLYAGYLILKSELDSRSLFSELEKIFKKVLDESAVAEVEKNLLELYRDLDLLNKLLKLELTRSDWSRAHYRRDWINPEAMARRLLSMIEDEEKGRPFTNRRRMQIDPTGLLNVFQTAFLFYDHARKREQVFFETINREMLNRKIEKAVLVTGGFHTEGLMDMFRQEEINYGILMPHISKSDKRIKYVEAMMEAGQTMFDFATIEIVNILQNPARQVLQGASIAHKARLVTGAFFEVLEKSGIQNVEKLMPYVQFFNESEFAKSMKLRLEISKDGQGTFLNIQGQRHVNRKGHEVFVRFKQVEQGWDRRKQIVFTVGSQDVGAALRQTEERLGETADTVLAVLDATQAATREELVTAAGPAIRAEGRPIFSGVKSPAFEAGYRMLENMTKVQREGHRGLTSSELQDALVFLGFRTGAVSQQTASRITVGKSIARGQQVFEQFEKQFSTDARVLFSFVSDFGLARNFWKPILDYYAGEQDYQTNRNTLMQHASRLRLSGGQIGLNRYDVTAFFYYWSRSKEIPTTMSMEEAANFIPDSVVKEGIQSRQTFIQGRDVFKAIQGQFSGDLDWISAVMDRAGLDVPVFVSDYESLSAPYRREAAPIEGQGAQAPAVLFGAPASALQAGYQMLQNLAQTQMEGHIGLTKSELQDALAFVGFQTGAIHPDASSQLNVSKAIARGQEFFETFQSQFPQDAELFSEFVRGFGLSRDFWQPIVNYYSGEHTYQTNRETFMRNAAQLELDDGRVGLNGDDIDNFFFYWNRSGEIPMTMSLEEAASFIPDSVSLEGDEAVDAFDRGRDIFAAFQAQFSDDLLGIQDVVGRAGVNVEGFILDYLAFKAPSAIAFEEEPKDVPVLEGQQSIRVGKDMTVETGIIVESTGSTVRTEGRIMATPGAKFMDPKEVMDVLAKRFSDANVPNQVSVWTMGILPLGTAREAVAAMADAVSPGMASAFQAILEKHPELSLSGPASVVVVTESLPSTDEVAFVHFMIATQEGKNFTFIVPVFDAGQLQSKMDQANLILQQSAQWTDIYGNTLAPIRFNIFVQPMGRKFDLTVQRVVSQLHVENRRFGAETVGDHTVVIPIGTGEIEDAVRQSRIAARLVNSRTRDRLLRGPSTFAAALLAALNDRVQANAVLLKQGSTGEVIVPGPNGYEMNTVSLGPFVTLIAEAQAEAMAAVSA